MRILLVSVMLIFFTGCSEAKNNSCDSALASLESAYRTAIMQGPDKTTMDKVKNTIKATTSKCDVTKYDTAYALARGYFTLSNAEGALESLKKIVPANEDEKVLKIYEIAHLYVNLHREKEAEKEVAILLKEFSDYNHAHLARVEYICTFKRCATVLDSALKLEEWQPSNPLMKLWLASSLADRHEFFKASDKFDQVLSEGGLWAFNEQFAIVGVISFSNSRQKEKALNLFRQFTALRYTEDDKQRDLYISMEKVANDKTNMVYLYSKWPIE
jgi:tetratricopeptide (TPR) repeat protein